MDPIRDPILPQKFLGYSRESNPGPLRWRTIVLTAISNRRSNIIIIIIIMYIKAARLRWIGHVERMSAERMQKKIMASKLMQRKQRSSSFINKERKKQHQSKFEIPSFLILLQ